MIQSLRGSLWVRDALADLDMIPHLRSTPRASLRGSGRTPAAWGAAGRSTAFPPPPLSPPPLRPPLPTWRPPRNPADSRTRQPTLPARSQMPAPRWGGWRWRARSGAAAPAPSQSPHVASAGGRAGLGSWHGSRNGAGPGPGGAAKRGRARSCPGGLSVRQPGGVRGRGSGRPGRSVWAAEAGGARSAGPAAVLALSERSVALRPVPARAAHKNPSKRPKPFYFLLGEHCSWIINLFPPPPVSSVNCYTTHFVSTCSFTSLLVYSYLGASRKYPYRVVGQFCCQDIIKLDRSSIPVLWNTKNNELRSLGGSILNIHVSVALVCEFVHVCYSPIKE